MADHKFTVDLTGLNLSEAEQSQISAAINRAAMSEVAALSTARGKANGLDFNIMLNPRGGRILAKVLPVQ